MGKKIKHKRDPVEDLNYREDTGPPEVTRPLIIQKTFSFSSAAIWASLKNLFNRRKK
jgi:hypothetical protein